MRADRRVLNPRSRRNIPTVNTVQIPPNEFDDEAKTVPDVPLTLRQLVAQAVRS